MNYLSKRLGDWSLPSDRSAVMGILNVTPDSFSDGGRWQHPDKCVGRIHEMMASGADIIDIGAESTRPGADPVSYDDQMNRLEPVLDGIESITVPLCIDTRNARVADTCCRAGFEIINDVSAAAYDPDMLDVAAGHNCVFIAMHMRGTPLTMDEYTHYADVVDQVIGEWQVSVDKLITAGCSRDNVWFDPGFGFAKTAEQCWQLVRALIHGQGPECQVVAGVSRKRFTDLRGLPAVDRDPAANALVALMAQSQKMIFRVHDVCGAVQAVHVAAEVKAAA